MSQPASAFTPRKEFLRTPRHTRNSFALLAFSGPNCVRLHSFSPQTAHSVRRVLEQFAPILTVRDDAPSSLCEFTVDKRPWANPRSVPSEKLLVDILVAVYQSGYSYLSTMDYGKEADDRLVMVFSKTEPVPPSVYKSSTLHTLPFVSTNESSTSSLSENLPIKHIPFVISFSSMTVMRVISPPLHLTPAILQACRGAWPRGVISEKTVYENSYEFKLKGYGLFEQDTFAADSLQHILALLSALDAQSFTLIASISLTSHSRIKDLWLFTAPAPEDTPSDLLEVPSSEASALRRYSFPPGQLESQHKKQTADPSPAIPHSPLSGNHNKSSSEGAQRRVLPVAQQGNVLRKASPRAQVPIDIRNSEIFHQDTDMPNRTLLPSVIPAGAVNMTGVGSSQTPEVFYESSPFSPGTITHHNHVASGPTSPSLQRAISSDHSTGRVKTPPLLASSSSKPPLPQVIDTLVVAPNTPTNPAPLLGSMAFRDSSMTSDTELTREIPIKWTGPLNEEWDKAKKRESRIADNGTLPGGWQPPSPIAEQREGSEGEELSQRRETPILQNESRIEAPEIIKAELRKSEAALVEIIKSTSPPISTPQKKEKDCTSPGGAGNNGKGWVLVNVEDTPESPQPCGGSEHKGSPGQTPSASVTGLVQPKPVSPEAKAIVVIDVLNSKNNAPTGVAKEGDSRVKQLFSLGRKDSKKGKLDKKG